MIKERNITVPNLNADFENAANPALREKQPETVEGIATRSELKQRSKTDKELTSKMQTPKMAQTLEIDGRIKNQIDKIEFEKNLKEYEANRDRMQYLDRRLKQKNLTKEFNRNR